MPVALSNEITEAYLRFWKVRSEAAYELNPDILLQVSAGAQLDRERGLIAQLQAEGDVGLTLVDHSFRIVYADGSRAIVYDEYKNRSYAVDASRKTSPGPPPDSPELWRVAFELRRVEGYWKVTDSERYE